MHIGGEDPCSVALPLYPVSAYLTIPGVAHESAESMRLMVLPHLFRKITAEQLVDKDLYRTLRLRPVLGSFVREVSWEISIAAWDLVEVLEEEVNGFKGLSQGLQECSLPPSTDPGLRGDAAGLAAARTKTQMRAAFLTMSFFTKLENLYIGIGVRMEDGNPDVGDNEVFDNTINALPQPISRQIKQLPFLSTLTSLTVRNLNPHALIIDDWIAPLLRAPKLVRLWIDHLDSALPLAPQNPTQSAIRKIGWSDSGVNERLDSVEEPAAAHLLIAILGAAANTLEDMALLLYHPESFASFQGVTQLKLPKLRRAQITAPTCKAEELPAFRNLMHSMPNCIQLHLGIGSLYMAMVQPLMLIYS